MADFSFLPDVVWVRILSYLPLRDRSSVAQTCHILNNIFRHPSLWHAAVIQLLGRIEEYHKIPLMKPSQYLELVKNFGPYIQDLRLLFRGYSKEIPPECREVIEALTENCRFESLHLEVSSVVTAREITVEWGRRETDLAVLGELVKNAYRLKAFTLAAWPIYRGLRTVNILEMLMQNEKVKDTLQKLSLFWLEANRSTWATLNVILPTPEQVIQTVSHFSNLRSLYLRSTMISDDAVAHMGKGNVRLEYLGILVTFDRHVRRGSIPYIQSTTWTKLTQHCPGLRVEFTIATRIPFFDLAELLKPEIPVSALNFMKFSECTQATLQSISDKYCGTLQRFADYSEISSLNFDPSDSMDEDLTALVTKATKLHHFLYAGAILADTVVALATLHGSRWLTFQVKSTNIVTQSATQEAYNPDIVVHQINDEYIVARHRPTCIQLEQEVEAATEALIEKVASVLGQPWWKPMDKVEGFVLPEDDVATWVATPRIHGAVGGR